MRWRSARNNRDSRRSFHFGQDRGGSRTQSARFSQRRHSTFTRMHVELAPRLDIAFEIPTSNCINRNIARYRPAPCRDYIGKRDSATRCMLIGQKFTRPRFSSPSRPVPSHRSGRRGSRGSPSVERTRRDRDRLSLLVSVTVGKVRAYKPD